jgi:hypothetical protein
LTRETCKDDDLDVGIRVFCTLIGEQDDPHREKLQAQRNSKAIAMLFKTLRENGLLTEKQVDNILWGVLVESER